MRLLSTSVVLITLSILVLLVETKRGKDHDARRAGAPRKQGRRGGHPHDLEHPMGPKRGPHGDRHRARGPAGGRPRGVYSSIAQRFDDTILIDLGRGWTSLFGGDRVENLEQQATTTTSSPYVSEKLPLPDSGELIRLRATDGFMNSGVVEVHRAGRWGVVCDDSWDIKDANVACRQLGFQQGAQGAPGESHYKLPPNRWSEDDILMDDVDCDGTETSLQRCRYEAQDDCTLSEAASVVCRPNAGCPEDWVGSGDSCYRFFGGAKNWKAAGAKCKALNGSLVSVDTPLENHFLSNVLTLTASEDDHLWYTSGRLSKKAWRWYRTVMRPAKKSRKAKKGKKAKKDKKDKKKKGRGKKGKGRKRTPRTRRRRSARSSMRNMRSAVDVSRWFPGWKGTGRGSEPTGQKGHTCLVLTDQFELPNGTTVSVDYFYWKAERCRQRGQTISFICESPTSAKPKECYTGIGDDYRGRMSQTDIGTPCIAWSGTAVNDASHPGKGLGDHNYCRNPDNDQRPWCWVGRGKFGFCPVPFCSDTTTPPTTTPDPDTFNCPAEEFFCTMDDGCLPEKYVCDGEEDCGDGEDELDCEYNMESFDLYEDRIPDESLNNLTYANVPLETCSTYCVDNTYFPCMSFVYNEDERECQLLDAGEDSQLRLVPSFQHDYYLMQSDQANCFGSFRCSNGRCVDEGKTCDGHDDCGDASDEEGCSVPPEPMSVRLVDGEENSGRVEVQYLGEWGTICDDEWDIKDARVVCRMLGYPDAVRASVLGEYGSGRGDILLDDVQCAGNETSLQDCPKAPWKQHNCHSYESAGVECRTKKACTAEQFACGDLDQPDMCVDAKKVCDGMPDCPAGQEEVDCELHVELVNGTGRHEGTVVLTRNGLSGTVCDDGWGEEQARVVCTMMGYSDGGDPTSESHFGRISGLIWMDDVVCEGGEQSLSDCVHTGWAVHDCSDLENAGVSCHTKDTSTPMPTIPKPKVNFRVPPSVFSTEDASEGSRIMAVLATREGKLVVAESKGKRLMMSSLKSPTRFTSVTPKMTYSPWNLLQLADGTIAVTFYWTYIDIYNITGDDLVYVRRIRTDRHYVGIAQGQDPYTLIVSSGKSAPQRLDEIDIQGRLLRNVLETRTLMANPYDLRVYGEHVFVADWGMDSLFAVHIRSGQVITTIGKLDLEHLLASGPTALDIDESGNLYVGVSFGAICVNDTGCIIRITQAGQVDVLTQFTRNLVGGSPQALQVTDDALLVSWSFKESSDAPFVSDVTSYQLKTPSEGGEEEEFVSSTRMPTTTTAATTTITTTTELPVSTTVSPSDAVVHLVDGSSSNEGRVELVVLGNRYTICDDSFDDKDAAVICRMAGFPDGGTAVTEAGFGAGDESLPILFDEVDCTGAETSVLDCGNRGLGIHNCAHSEDAGVVCHLPGHRGSTTTTRKTPTSILGSDQCGHRPMEQLLRTRRQAFSDAGNLTGPRTVAEVPRFQKIIGGDLAQHGMFPWQVGVNKVLNIYADGSLYATHWCGATIISRHWIVSAAHCFSNLPKSRVLLKVGDHSHKAQDKGEQTFKVEELIMHRDYDRATHDYDFALLKVKSDDGEGIQFNDYVQPACLPTDDTEYLAQTKCYISGWGQAGDDNNRHAPNTLRQAVVPLLSFSTCNYLYKGDLSSRMLCAGYLKGGIDTCQGDSGGPLVCKVDDAYTLMGVTSWGFGCAQPNSPGVYARTKEFLTWIEATIMRYS